MQNNYIMEERRGVCICEFCCIWKTRLQSVLFNLFDYDNSFAESHTGTEECRIVGICVIIGIFEMSQQSH